MSERERIIGLLRTEWGALSALLATLSDDEWSAPALPGWDVHDVVAHLVGTERSLTGASQPSAPADLGDRAHVHNDIGKSNEAWIEHYRTKTHADLLADFNAVTAARLVALDAMTDAEFEAPSWTPVGQANYARFMRVRAFDCWMHEQDIRVAIDQPGHESGPLADEAVREDAAALGYMVGKRGQAPDGSSVTFHLTGGAGRDLHVVVDGRAKQVESLDHPPTVSITMPATLFLRLAGGRLDPASALDRITIEGDEQLGLRIATNLAYTI